MTRRSACRWRIKALSKTSTHRKIMSTSRHDGGHRAAAVVSRTFPEEAVMGRKSQNRNPAGGGLLPSGLTRRGFLKGAGVSAATTALLDTTLVQMAEAQAKADNDGVVGPGEVKVTLNINGQDKQVTV